MQVYKFLHFHGFGVLLFCLSLKKKKKFEAIVTGFVRCKERNYVKPYIKPLFQLGT